MLQNTEPVAIPSSGVNGAVTKRSYLEKYSLHKIWMRSWRPISRQASGAAKITPGLS